MARVVDCRGNEFTYSPELQCSWIGWKVTGPDSLALYLREFDCCHMPAAIRMGKILMPDVRIIQTYSGKKPDTKYFRVGNRWDARLMVAMASSPTPAE